MVRLLIREHEGVVLMNSRGRLGSHALHAGYDTTRKILNDSVLFL